MNPNDCKLRAIVSIANPFNIKICNDSLKLFGRSLYRDGITENFKWLLRHHLSEMEPNIKQYGIDINAAMKATTPEEFDEVITRRLNGYHTVEEMYNDIGCDKYIKNIDIPVLMFSSKRDPICVSIAAPIDEINSKPNMLMAFTKAGSHAEWFTGVFPERVFINFNPSG